MRRWRDQPFRPWDALLSVPIIGILGVMACTLTAKRKRRPDPTFSLARLAVMVAIPLGGSFHV